MTDEDYERVAAVMTEALVVEIPHLGQFLAEWPGEPFRHWYLDATAVLAKEGLRRMAEILGGRRFP